MIIGVETKVINGLKIVYNHNRNMIIATLSDGKINELKEFLKENIEAFVLVQPTTYEKDGFVLNVDNLDILKSLDLKRIFLSSGTITVKDFSGIYSQKNLIELKVIYVDIDIDFSYFKKLERISYYWTPKTKGFFDCVSLKAIKIWKYKSKDSTLNEFNAFVNLEELAVTQSNIKSISGIEKLQHLRKLELSYNLKLQIDFKELGFILPNVEDLEINTCKNVGLDFVKVFPNVKKLKLVKFQDIEQLKPILDGLPLLEEIFVGETNILESDNTYYTTYTNIKRFFFAEKKYHKLKYREVESALGIESEF